MWLQLLLCLGLALVPSSLAEDCPACPARFRPVCGTDGVTYTNLCFLRASQCKGFKVDLRHRGLCGKNPADERKRQVSVTGCVEACNRSYFPLCGYNGVTYGNRCLYEAAVCKGELAADPEPSFGRCPEETTTTTTTAAPTEMACPQFCTLIYAPLCGYNGVTYANRCLYEAAVCKGELAADPEPAFGQCPEVSTTTTTTAAPTEMACPQICTMIYAPVCVNGRKYASECSYRAAACRDSTLRGAVGPCEPSQ